MKYRTKESAIENVKLFFSNHPTEDTITLEQAWEAWGRDLDDKAGNMSWFSNKLTHLKYHNLVKPVYAHRNSRRVLAGIQLAMEGKRALGRLGKTSDEDSVSNEVSGTRPMFSLEEIMKAIPKLRKENPDFDITFDVKLRNG